MKITDIKPLLISDEVREGANKRKHRTLFFVVVETDEGIYGIGESCLTSREFALEGMVNDLKDLLIGEDPFRTEHLWQLMWRSGFYNLGQVLSAAMAAIDIALWDIKGKKLDVPVYELLGGKTRDKVLTYCHLHGQTPEETLSQAKTKVAEGWKVLRFEVCYGEDLLMDGRWTVNKAIEEFKQLREALGPDIELAFDIHTKLTPPEAVRLCRAVEPYRPFSIEDPLRSEYPAGYRMLRQQTAVPIAAGEQYGTKWMFHPVIEENLIDYARIDLCIAGGLTEGKKIAAMAEAHMIDIAVHNPIGPVSSAACLHFNLATPNVLVQEMPRVPGEILSDLITTNAVWEDGYLSYKDAPGLGVTLNADAIDKYPFVHTHLPILHREDGSFTGW